jgi:outer membrane protein assembly factor BamB
MIRTKSLRALVAAATLSCLPTSFTTPFSSVTLGTEPDRSWPQFLGPTAQGTSTSTDLPERWSETEGVLWKQELPGSGWSSPIVLKDRIYLTAAIEKGKTLSLALLICDLETGKLLEEIPIFEHQAADLPDIHQKNSQASPTPIISGDRLYLHFGHLGTAATDLAGNLIWKRTDLQYPPVHGNGGSPLLYYQLLIFNCDGGEAPYVIALDKDTGETVWKTARPIDSEKSFSFSTPTVIEVQGQPQLITAGSDIVQALAPATGIEIWRVRYEGFSVVPRPIYVNGTVLLSTGYMRPQLLAITPTGKGDVTQSHLKWSKPNVAPNTPSIVSDGTLVYCVTDAGIARAIRVSNGEEVWRKRLGGNYSASPLLADGKVYFQSEQGECVIVAANVEGTEIARNELPGRIFASYAVVGDDLIIRSETALYRIGR